MTEYSAFPIQSDFRDRLLADIDRLETAHIAKQNKEAYDRLLENLAREGGKIALDSVEVEVILEEAE